MPIKKYRIETDKGNFEVEVDEAYQPDPGSTSATAGAMARREVSGMSGTKTKGERVISDNPDKEPETWGGGFVKSIKDQVGKFGMGLRPVLESAASPKTVGDFLGLLNPQAAGAASTLYPKIPRVVEKAGVGLERAGELASPASIPLAVAEYMMKGNMKGAATVAAAPTAAKYAGRGTSAIGRALGKNLPKVFESKPAARALEAEPEVEDVIGHLPKDIIPEPTGDPSMAAMGDEARFNDTREAEALSGPRSPEKAVEELGAGVVKPSIESLLLGNSGPRITSLKADKMTPEMMQELRRYLGADKLADLTGLTPEQVRDFASGPSRTPLSIEDQLNQGHDLFDHLP